MTINEELYLTDLEETLLELVEMMDDFIHSGVELTDLEVSDAELFLEQASQLVSNGVGSYEDSD